MPEIVTQKHCQELRDLPFCYLCGHEFVAREDVTRDHVPPSSLFAESDKNWPLILPTHLTCNNRQAPYDEVIGQLISLLHGKMPAPEHNRLNIHVYNDQNTGQPLAGLHDVAVRPIIGRWVRGFHAALYREFLPGKSGGYIYTPFPEMHAEGDRLTITGFDSQRALFVEEIKKNRTAKSIDRIVIRNGKCVYECMWTQLDNRRPICVFALRLYNWEHLGLQTGVPRGCVGYYAPESGKPKSGAAECLIDFNITNLQRLDPFDE